MFLLKQKRAEISYILFEAGRACNLNCSFCYNHWKSSGTQEPGEHEGYQMGLNTLKKLFRLAQIKHVTFTGGEPMLAERIGELVLYCRMKKASVSIITNGTVGGEAEFRQLIKLGVQLFELPVHSSVGTIHDRMTNTEGSWEKSVNSIRSITAMGGYVVPVIVLTKFNVNDIGNTIEFIRRLGFNRIMLNRYNFGGKEAYWPENVAATKEALNEAFVVANRLALKYNMTISSNVCTPHCVIDPSKYGQIRFSNCSADVLHRPLTMSVSGDLRFCNHSPSVLGNIFEDQFETIIRNGRVMGSLQTRPNECEGCSKYEKCLGGCRAAAEQTGGSFSHVDPVYFYDPSLKSN